MPGPRKLSLSRNLKRLLEMAVLAGAVATIPLAVALEAPQVFLGFNNGLIRLVDLVLEFPVGVAAERSLEDAFAAYRHCAATPPIIGTSIL